MGTRCVRWIFPVCFLVVCGWAQQSAPPAKPSPKPYWIYSDAVLQPEGPQPKNIQEAARQLRPLLEETVRDHLIADRHHRLQARLGGRQRGDHVDQARR